MRLWLLSKGKECRGNKSRIRGGFDDINEFRRSSYSVCSAEDEDEYEERSSPAMPCVVLYCDGTWILREFFNDSLKQQIASAESNWLAY